MKGEPIKMKEKTEGNIVALWLKNRLQSRTKLISLIRFVDYQVGSQASY